MLSFIRLQCTVYIYFILLMLAQDLKMLHGTLLCKLYIDMIRNTVNDAIGIYDLNHQSWIILSR